MSMNENTIKEALRKRASDVGVQTDKGGDGITEIRIHGIREVAKGKRGDE